MLQYSLTNEHKAYRTDMTNGRIGRSDALTILAWIGVCVHVDGALRPRRWGHVSVQRIYHRSNQGCLDVRPPVMLGRPSRPPDKGIFKYIRTYSSIFKVFFKNIQRICPVCPVRTRYNG
jgi:hypothetical protein